MKVCIKLAQLTIFQTNTCSNNKTSNTSKLTIDFRGKMQIVCQQLYTLVSAGYIPYFSNILEQQVQHVITIPAGHNNLI